jgi:hypothetical protein
MTTTATLQHTIQIRPSRLAALLVAVAMLTAVTTWSVGNVADHASHTSAPKSEAVSSAYVDGVTALSPEQRAATYGNVPTDLQRAVTVSHLNPAEQAAIYGNVSSSQEFVDGVTHLSPAQQAAIYGNVSTSQQFLDGMTHLTPAQLAAMFGNVPFDSTP